MFFIVAASTDRGHWKHADVQKRKQPSQQIQMFLPIFYSTTSTSSTFFSIFCICWN